MNAMNNPGNNFSANVFVGKNINTGNMNQNVEM